MQESDQIFIIGPARSGTTIVASAINSSRDCFVIREGNIYLKTGTLSFRESFNQRKLAEGTIWDGKGNFLPAVVGEGNAESVLSILSTRYKRVGDKIALGPGVNSNILLAEYMLKHHWSSTYIFCLRPPVQTFLSQMRMFSVSPQEVIKAWVEALILMLMIYGNTEESYFVMHETLSAKQFQILGSHIGLDISINPESVGELYQVNVESDLSEFGEMQPTVEICQDIYKFIIESWSPDTLRLDQPHGSFNTLSEIINMLVPIVKTYDPHWNPLRNSLGYRIENLLDQMRDLSETQGLNTERAKAVVSELGVFASKRPETAFWTGLVRLAHQDYDGADSALTQAISADYQTFWALTHRLQARAALGRIADARQDLDDARRNAPEGFDFSPHLALLGS